MSRSWQRTLPHDVYEIVAKTGTILYVGLSMNTERRLLQHRSKHWFSDASLVRIFTYPNLDAAKRSEGLRIAEAKPPHNIQTETWSASLGRADPPALLKYREEPITHGR